MRCDCGETEKPHHSKEKCIHLRDAEERAKAGVLEAHPEEHDAAHLAEVAEEQGCCCHHGGKCTCAVLKKEIDKEGSTTPPHGPAVKPRLETTKSDGSITVFQNGHHKPVHRKNHMAHDCGMPYKMPLPRANTDHSVARVARRSVDSLALDSKMAFDSSACTTHDNTPFNTARRMSKSEQPSPKFGPTQPCRGLTDSRLTDIDFAALDQSRTNQSMPSTLTDTFGFSSADPMSGVADSSYDPWSSFPSGESMILPNNNPFGVWPTNETSSAIGQPALTAASSGTQSEIDEIPAIDDVYAFGMPSIQEDASNPSINNLIAQSSPQSNRRSLPADFFSSNNFIMPNSGGEWSASAEDFAANDPTRSKAFDVDQQMSFESPWQMPCTNGLPQRPLGGLPFMGRPTSQSVGATSAPNDDLMQQLFPGIDVNSSTFGSSPNLGGKNLSAAPTSAPVDFGPLDDNVGFTSQPWADGSMIIPNDPFSSPYDMDQDFPDADFSSWSQ